MTGFEAFRVYNSINLHFKTKDYHYERGTIPIKIETYYSNSYYDIFEQCLVRYDDDYLEGLIVSNILHGNGFMKPSQLKNKMAHKIKEKWEDTLDNIDQIFSAELLLLMEKYDLNNPYDLFEKVYRSINEQIYSDVIAVDGIQSVINDNIEMNEIKDNDFFLYLSNMDYHFIVVLDAIMKKYYRCSPLQEFMEKNPNVKEHRFIMCYKYSCLLPMSELIKKPKIKMFTDCLHNNNK